MDLVETILNSTTLDSYGVFNTTVISPSLFLLLLKIASTLSFTISFLIVYPKDED